LDHPKALVAPRQAVAERSLGDCDRDKKKLYKPIANVNRSEYPRHIFPYDGASKQYHRKTNPQ